jgi:hypothetical protein
MTVLEPRFALRPLRTRVFDSESEPSFPYLS